MADLDYFHPKYAVAARELATGEGAIHERLEIAWEDGPGGMGSFIDSSGMGPDITDQDLLQRLRDLDERMNGIAHQEAIRAMSTPEAVEVATEILDIHEALAELDRQHHP